MKCNGFVAIMIMLLQFLFEQGIAQQMDNRNLAERIDLSRKSIDTILHHSIFQWYIQHDVNRKGETKCSIKFVDIPVFEIDDDCFLGIHCDYAHPEFPDCIKEAPSNVIQALFTMDNNLWYSIAFHNGMFSVDNVMSLNQNFYGIKYSSTYEIIENVGANVFVLYGLFCRYDNGEILVYIGDQRFEKFANLFRSGRVHSIRFAMGCN